MLDASRIEVPYHAVVEILRRMTEGERLAVANRMWRSARTAVDHVVRGEHPEWTEPQVQQEIVRRMLHGAL
jgi:hypothetical protein